MLSQKVIRVEANNSVLYTIDDFISPADVQTLRNECLRLQLVDRPAIRMYGKIAHSQRAVGLFSDTVEGYAFSGQIQKSAPLPSFLASVLDRFNNTFDTKANAILVNRYGGDDYLAAHSDKEAELVSGKVLIVSLGSSRTMRITDKKTGAMVVDVVTQEGQLLCMDGDFQKHYKHEILPGLATDDVRISLSARQHTTGKLKSKATLVNATPTHVEQ